MLVLYSAVISFIGFILTPLYSVVYEEGVLPSSLSIFTIDYGNGILMRLIIQSIPMKSVKRFFCCLFFVVAVNWDVRIVGQTLP